MRKISKLATILITSLVMILSGLVASPIATASENETVQVSATFPLGSSVLTKAQKAEIKKALASSGLDATFVVTGIAGKFPGVSDRRVQALAKKRAQAIKAYLLSLGVSETRATTQAKTQGKSRWIVAFRGERGSYNRDGRPVPRTFDCSLPG